MPIPRSLARKSFAEVHLHRLTGCNVVGIEVDGEITPNPDPHRPLPSGCELVLVGTDEARSEFFHRFPAGRWSSARR